MENNNCGCRGPALRSYQHHAHKKNAEENLEQPPDEATQITPRQAKALSARGYKIHRYYIVAGSRGGPSTRMVQVRGA